jgi:hypothetical protein
MERSGGGVDRQTGAGIYKPRCGKKSGSTRCIIPFVILQWFGLLTIALFPQLATYLPDLFFG